jgi:heme/copper-type cytochrome/quinol oxidase subunit 2
VRTAFRSSSRLAFGVVAFALTAVVGVSLAAAVQARRDFEATARRYTFDVSNSGTSEIRVMQNDLVRITLRAEDIPHSFTIEDAPYRIMRRAEPGRPVTFDFRADQPGRFRFFCNLTADERCREMQGTLIVERR